MANKTIHELTPASTVSSDYQFAIYDVDGNTTKKASVSDVLGTEDLLYADDEGITTEEVDFSSQDTEVTPSSSTSVDLLTGTDSWSARFVKISQMFKNIRFLLNKLGTTDISIGNGTVTGALSTLRPFLTKTVSKTADSSNFIASGIDARIYHVLAVYQSNTDANGVVCNLGRNNNNINAYFYAANGTAYTGAVNVIFIYVAI